MKRRWILVALLLSGVGAAMMTVVPAPGSARDHGHVGQVFPVTEPDLLATIEARLRRAEAGGEIARMNKAFAERTQARVRRPDPVAGITPALRPRSWACDPTVTIERDLRDAKGTLIAAEGQKVNPLDFLTIRQALVFVDGADPDQLKWATSRYAESEAKIIFVAGSPIEEMTRRQRRFYFDQQGRLTGTFGIEHTPAVVSAAGRVMRVSEVRLDKGRAG